MFKFLNDVDELSLSTGKSININPNKNNIETMNKFRTHNCSELTEKEIEKSLSLDGCTEKEIMVIYYL